MHENNSITFAKVREKKNFATSSFNLKARCHHGRCHRKGAHDMLISSLSTPGKPVQANSNR
jgi:hypothetical protein